MSVVTSVDNPGKKDDHLNETSLSVEKGQAKVKNSHQEVVTSEDEGFSEEVDNAVSVAQTARDQAFEQSGENTTAAK